MGKKTDKDYFAQMEQTAQLIKEASYELEKLLYNLHLAESMAKEIHRLENQADAQYHNLMESLSVAFITPLEREDIMGLADTLDNIMDAIDDTAIRFHMLQIGTPRKEAFAFSRLFVKLSDVTLEAFGELKNFKKPKRLLQLIREMESLKESGDQIYQGAVRKLFADSQERDIIETIKWREMFETMENCCDKFELAAKRMRDAILKNN